MHLKDILNLVVNANSKLSDFNVCLNSFYKRVEWKETNRKLVNKNRMLYPKGPKRTLQ